MHKLSAGRDENASKEKIPPKVRTNMLLHIGWNLKREKLSFSCLGFGDGNHKMLRQIQVPDTTFLELL